MLIMKLVMRWPWKYSIAKTDRRLLRVLPIHDGGDTFGQRGVMAMGSCMHFTPCQSRHLPGEVLKKEAYLSPRPVGMQSSLIDSPSQTNHRRGFTTSDDGSTTLLEFSRFL